MLIIPFSTDLVCQSGPGAWPSLIYAQAAIYPMAHSAAQVVMLLFFSYGYICVCLFKFYFSTKSE